MAEDKNARTGLWLGGLPWWQAVICILLCLIPMYLTVQGKDGPKMVQSTTMAGTKQELHRYLLNKYRGKLVIK